MSSQSTKHKVSQSTLKHSDQAVLRYLDGLARRGEGEICTASIPQIASACDISERQVQISTRRLINARLLRRVGYDFSNPDRMKRGTIYKVRYCKNGDKRKGKRAIKKSSTKFLLFWSED
jgi:hypothetical protein